VPTYFATPGFARQGVVAGFVLSAPEWEGIAQAGTGAISFTFYNSNVTLATPNRTIQIKTGYQHWLNIGGRVYSYIQQDSDAPAPYGTNPAGTSANIATQLASYINAAPDPNCTAVANVSANGVVTLTPRGNTGAAVTCTASETNGSQTLVELTGNELIPVLTPGVLFAQGAMYAPSASPVLPAAPASQKSYLYYSSTDGFYWSASSSPTVSGDASIGWVLTTATEIIALSSRRIGVGPEAAVVPGGPVAIAIGTGVSVSGDTGFPSDPPSMSFAVAPSPGVEMTYGRLAIGAAFSGSNYAGIDALTVLLYYIDELAGPAATLTADMTDSATALSGWSAPLPVASPATVTFTFYAATVGLLIIGPGYVHNITIGTTMYSYVQQTSDTAADVAAALAAAIQEAADPNALAVANGATVTLTPLESNGDAVVVSASDGNAPGTLTETQPSYYLIETAGAAPAYEVVELLSVSGLSIARGCLGTSAVALAAGSLIWQVQAMTRFYALAGALIGTADWPAVLAEEPFRAKGLVSAIAWAANEYGDSPISDFAGTWNTSGGRMRCLSGSQIDLFVGGTLAVGANQTYLANGLQQAVAVGSIVATVQGAPTGAALRCRVNVGGAPFMVLEIAAGATVVQADMTGAAGAACSPETVDGLTIAAGAMVSLDILQVGSTFPGSGLSVTVKC